MVSKSMFSCKKSSFYNDPYFFRRRFLVLPGFSGKLEQGEGVAKIQQPYYSVNSSTEASQTTAIS